MNVLINRPAFIILSACQGKDVQADEYQTRILREILKLTKLGETKEVLGCYKGKKEVSFYVQTNDISTLLNLSKQFNQECILYVDSDRKACLISREGVLRNTIDVGYFRQVKQDVALQSEAFTYDHENDGYYICK